MQETAQQYAERVIGYTKNQDPLRILQRTSAKLERLIRGFSKKKLTKRPGSNRWSVAEILSHLAEDEIVFGFRLRMILGANGTPIQGFDQNQWIKNSGYLVRNPKQALDLFHVVRQSNIALLKSVPKKMWNQYGLHSERGKESIERYVRLVAGHDIGHLRQMQQGK